MHAPSSSSKPFSIHDLPLLPCQFALECNQNSHSRNRQAHSHNYHK
ncbi:hypothetical protein NC652_017786 [Populus alba x Populus x berolinensis]|nr:hypothetical protein NC651_017118 [Populus alba x Populus x berolinensis]KAJ6924622.1 hypothetical protein NC652_017786 [Populus alba x Populus x berolinensis]